VVTASAPVSVTTETFFAVKAPEATFKEFESGETAGWGGA
jgi:hypothetical protein